MPHTQSRYQQDLGFTDGKLFAGAEDIAFVSSGGSITLTRTNPTQYFLRAANSTTGFYTVNIASFLARRLGFFEDLQEQFGSQSGAGIAGSAQVRNYRPDQLGAMNAAQQLQPRTAFKTKGIKINSLDVIYLVNSANASTLTCRADQVVYTNGGIAGGVVTNLLASAANGLVVTAAATMYVINVPIPNPAYFILNDAKYNFEVSIVTPGGGTFDMYGFDIAFEFNNN